MSDPAKIYRMIDELIAAVQTTALELFHDELERVHKEHVQAIDVLADRTTIDMLRLVHDLEILRGELAALRLEVKLVENGRPGLPAKG